MFHDSSELRSHRAWVRFYSFNPKSDAYIYHFERVKELEYFYSLQVITPQSLPVFNS